MRYCYCLSYTTIYLSLTPRNVVNFVFLYFFEAYLNCYPERAAGPNLQKMMKPSNLKPVKHVTVRRAGMIPILELQINRKGPPKIPVSKHTKQAQSIQILPFLANITSYYLLTMRGITVKSAPNFLKWKHLISSLI